MIRHLGLLLACATLAAGCATPSAVHELADKTSANVGIVSARLTQLSKESDRLFAARTDNVSRLQGITATQRANLAYDLALTRKSGEAADLDLMKDLQAWVQQVDDIFATAAAAEDDQRSALLAGQVKLDAKSQALQKIAESLSALAKVETTSERAKLLQNFAKEVSADAKKELDSGSASALAAKALIDHVRAAVAPGTPQ